MWYWRVCWGWRTSAASLDASPVSPGCCAAVTPLKCAQVGIFQVMLLGRSAAVAHAVVAPMEPFPAFRDASSGAPCFLLRIQHVLAVRPCRVSAEGEEAPSV